MKRKTTWVGKKPTERKGQNQNIIQRENFPGKWLGSEKQREMKCYLSMWRLGNWEKWDYHKPNRRN